MTPDFLQEAIIAALREEFKDLALPSRTGELKPLNFYRQDVPTPMGSDDEEEEVEDQAIPYIVVRITDGTFDDHKEAMHVSVALIISTYDEGQDKQGFRDVLSIITRIYRRLGANPHMGPFMCELPVEWALQTELETYPYHYGGMQLTFSIPGVRIEDPLT